MLASELNGRVLSIQSHVVHGYVGNRAAVFPLQMLGFEVDFVNSVQFSNHTGYEKGWKGQTLSGEQLSDLFQGLQNNHLEESYSHLLTGYIGSETFLEAILGILAVLKEKNPNLIYVCDPVLGDAGELYVPESLVNIYRERVLKHATIITPNQYEAEILSGIQIRSESDALSVIRHFHSESYNIPIVVLSSVELENDANHLTLYASNKQNTYKIRFKKLEGNFTGTGDALSALFLAFYKVHGNAQFHTALEKTIGAIQSILSRTPPGEELRLIESRFSIVDPPVENCAVIVESFI